MDQIETSRCAAPIYSGSNLTKFDEVSKLMYNFILALVPNLIGRTRNSRSKREKKHAISFKYFNQYQNLFTC